MKHEVYCSTEDVFFIKNVVVHASSSIIDDGEEFDYEININNIYVDFADKYSIDITENISCNKEVIDMIEKEIRSIYCDYISYGTIEGNHTLFGEIKERRV